MWIDDVIGQAYSLIPSLLWRKCHNHWFLESKMVWRKQAEKNLLKKLEKAAGMELDVSEGSLAPP